MDSKLKEQLIGQFRQYLESTPGEKAAQGEQSGEIDLYTLFAELAALKNEVRLESRQVKQALDHSRELIDGLGVTNQQFNDELIRRRQGEDELRQHAERPLLLEILELRDRIDAAIRSLREYRPGLIDRLRGSRARLVRGVGEGMEITLRRLDGLLARYQVSPIDPVGKRVDPNTMRVSSTEQRNDQDNGIVLAEPRKGFLCADKVLRPAEVIVNKKVSE
ncbi:MAG: nucleotide exchange factor GrpE [Gammaproteobacteria bacterium]|nr:nucleotide exchange factor GrpE [Gammaproteobacteria bacterium]